MSKILYPSDSQSGDMDVAILNSGTGHHHLGMSAFLGVKLIESRDMDRLPRGNKFMDNAALEGWGMAQSTMYPLWRKPKEKIRVRVES